MPLVFKESEKRKKAKLDWYRAGKDPLKFEPKLSFFNPDRLTHIKHDAPDNCNIIVFTTAGIQIFGRVLNNPQGTWISILDEQYQWNN